MNSDMYEEAIVDDVVSDEIVKPSAVEQMHTVSQMETQKSTLGVFELPCGYIDPKTQELITDVEVREITGYEEDMLASDKIPNSQKITLLLTGCIVRFGVVTDATRIGRMVQNLTTGDKTFLVFAIRRVTLGDELPIRERCPSCGVSTLFIVDLKEELQAKVMPDRRKRVFDVVLPSGKTARFRVSSGTDESRLARMRGKKKNLDGPSQAILMRLELLNDEPPTLKMVKSLGMSDRRYLMKKFLEVEGGIDTTLELDCPACGYDWKKDLDMKTASFFSPGDQQKL